MNEKEPDAVPGVLPGPAVVDIPIGLAIPATEFIWARKLIDVVKERIARMRKGNVPE